MCVSVPDVCLYALWCAYVCASVLGVHARLLTKAMDMVAPFTLHRAIAVCRVGGRIVWRFVKPRLSVPPATAVLSRSGCRRDGRHALSCQ